MLGEHPKCLAADSPHFGCAVSGGIISRFGPLWPRYKVDREAVSLTALPCRYAVETYSTPSFLVRVSVLWLLVYGVPRTVPSASFAEKIPVLAGFLARIPSTWCRSVRRVGHHGEGQWPQQTGRPSPATGGNHSERSHRLRSGDPCGGLAP